MLECVEAHALVMKFFGGDEDKTSLWFLTRNPLLGDISPNTMVELGRGRRLLEFVKQQLAENEFPGHDSSGPRLEWK